MSEKEIAPTIAATMAEAKRNIALLETNINYQNTTECRDRQLGFIESLLIAENAIGMGSAIRTDNLVKLAGLSDRRSLQKQIQRERESGITICSKSGGGYYIPISREELLSCKRTMRNRAISTLRSLRSIERALKKLDGQIELTDGKGVVCE